MNNRVDELDGLRGALSVIVVVGHLHVWLVPWFWGCMEAFYCLSAFLIGSIVFAGLGKQGFAGNYFARRALRIWPLYYVVLAFCLVFQSVLTHAMELDWKPGTGVIQSLFFVQNVELLAVPGAEFTTDRPGYPVGFDHSWSLALEEQFYVLTLFLCAVCTKLRLRYALLLLATLPFVSLTARVLGYHVWLLPARFDGFAAGLIVALLWHHRARLPACQVAVEVLGRFVLPVAAIAVAVLFLTLGRDHEGDIYHPVSVYGSSLFAILAMCLVSFLISQKGLSSTRWFRLPALGFLGRISYSTYLWHLPVIWYLKVCFSRAPALESIPFWMLAVPTIVLVSYASYLAIERPFLRMRPSKAQVPLRSDVVLRGVQI